MAARLILLGHIRYFTGNSLKEHPLLPGMTLFDSIKNLHIPPEELMGFFLNGKVLSPGHIIEEGETIEAVPYISGG
jgi:sulfur carrier protein ThiS